MSVGKTASKRQIRREKAPDESLSDTTGTERARSFGAVSEELSIALMVCAEVFSLPAPPMGRRTIYGLRECCIRNHYG
jgi:hypothetical protein